MYICRVDGETFHYPAANLKNCCVLSGTISSELNRAGTFDFQISPNNVCYTPVNKFKRLTSEVEVFWDDGLSTTRIFRGRILDSSRTFLGQISYKCEGWMAVLNDSIVIPGSLGLGGDSENGITTSVEAMLTALINLHNNQVDDNNKSLTPHIIGFNGANYNFPWPSCEKTLDYIQSNIISNEDIGGIMYVESSDIYLKKDDQEPSLQDVIQGRNLLDLTEAIEVSDFYTMIYPTGKDDLTLNGYTGWSSIDAAYPVVNGMIKATAAINTYGTIAYHEDYSEAETQEALYRKALATLKATVEIIPTIDVSALDLNIIDSSQPRFRVGTYINLVSPTYGIEYPYMCTASSIDICNPASTTYTLGRSADTLTTRQHSISMNTYKNLHKYTSEIANTRITASPYTLNDPRVSIESITFYKSNRTVYLSFEVVYLKHLTDSSATIMQFPNKYAPAQAVTGTAYDETTNGTWKLQVRSNGWIDILSGGNIEIGDTVTGNLTWMSK